MPVPAKSCEIWPTSVILYLTHGKRPEGTVNNMGRYISEQVSDFLISLADLGFITAHKTFVKHKFLYQIKERNI
jgi:hypothetical protein